MKRKLCLDIALLIIILGGLGAFMFMQQQQAPATESQTSDVAEQPIERGCCGATTVEGATSQATAGGCCGTPASDTVRSGDTSQQVQPSVTPETNKTSPPTLQNDDTATSGCGCGG